jgi:hypothetical protein
MTTMKFLTLLAFPVICGSALAASGPCDTPALAAATSNGFDQRMVEMREQQKAREREIADEITAIKRNMVATKRWTQKQSDMLVAPKLSTPEALAMEKRQMSDIMTAMDANMQFVEHMGRKDYVKACPHTQVMLDALTLTGRINEAHYLHMLAYTKKAAAGKR